MLTREIETRSNKQRSPKSRKRKVDQKTDWEKNLSKLRSRKRRLNREKPVKPVKTN